jgi:hypothetical protein
VTQPLTPSFLVEMVLGNFPWPRECKKPNHYSLHLNTRATEPHRPDNRADWDLEVGVTESDKWVHMGRVVASPLLDFALADAIRLYVLAATKDEVGGPVQMKRAAALSMVRAILDKVIEMKEKES